MTTGCKVWLWIVFICNILSAASGVVFMISNVALGLYTAIAGVILIIAAALLLFKQKKVGFYLMVAMALIALVVNVIQGINIIFALIGAVLSPAITYFFIKRNAAVFK